MAMWTVDVISMLGVFGHVRALEPAHNKQVPQSYVHTKEAQ